MTAMIDKITKYLAEGLTTNVIAQRCGCSYSHVGYVRRNLGKYRNPRGKPTKSGWPMITWETDANIYKGALYNIHNGKPCDYRGLA